MIGVSDLVDTVLEAPVIPSFTRIGFDVRSRLEHWGPPATDLAGRTVLLTGATSGLGLAATEQLAGAGAIVVLVGRDRARTRRVRDEVADRTGNDRLEAVAADLGDQQAVRHLADTVRSRHERLDVLVHNAGSLSSRRQTAPDGGEATVASQVVGPFLLTTLLLPVLRAATPGRVITMSSGGMYVAPLTVDELEMGDDYSGTEQYARAKRAQVTLNALWAERVDPSEVVFHAMHPGWADTPGVAESLPTFRHVVGPLLRSPVQGADTLTWLATADEAATCTGLFWHDRRPRPIHRLPRTRRSDTPQRRRQLWSWCVDRCGVDPEANP